MCGYGQQPAVQVYFLNPRTKVETAVCFRGCIGADGQPIKVLTPAEMGVLLKRQFSSDVMATVAEAEKRHKRKGH